MLSIGRDPSTVPPFDFAAIFTETAIDPFLLTSLVLAITFYLWGVSRLRSNGVHWPLTRTLAFTVGGIGTIAFVTMLGFGAYDETLFSVHMVQHMVLSMVSPIFLALGAPVTLALRALPKKGRDVLRRVLHWKIVKFYTFPLIGFGLFVGSPFVLYYTGALEAALRNEWLHQLMHFHFIAVGCLFFWPLIGIDPIPGRMSYPLRVLILFATIPIHAVLGLGIMQSSGLLAGGYYGELNLWWSDPYSDQNVGGGLLWGTGDLVGALMMGTALYQWMKASEREAAREDRRLDRLDAIAARRRAAEERSGEDAE